MSFAGTVSQDEIKRRRSLNNLGGEIQETDIPDNTVHSLFDKVNELGARLGEINWRGFYFFNSNPDFPIKNPVLYMPVNTTSPADEVRYGWDPAGVNKEMQAIATEFTEPIDIAWNNGASRTTGSPLGADIPPLGSVGVWLERTVNFNAPSLPQNAYEIALDYDRTDMVIPEGFGVAVMGNMGCGSLFNQILQRVELRAPDKIISTGGNSYKSDGRCWISSIKPLDPIWAMAFGESEWLSQSLINQYMNFFGLSKQYYSFNIYNVHFLIVSTKMKFSPGSAQHTFILKDLISASNDPRTDWIIVVQQNPFWHALDKTGKLYTNQTFRDIYSPIYEQYKVHLVLQGGPYNYQRLGIVNPTPVSSGGGTTTHSPLIYYGAVRGWNNEDYNPMSATTSHEICEAQTDPIVFGDLGLRSWKDYNSNPRDEISDICPDGQYPSGLWANGYWSNSDANCVIPGLSGSDLGSSSRFTNPQGGPVLATPRIFIIFWGSDWKNRPSTNPANGNPWATAAGFIDRIQNKLLGTNIEFFDKMTQYGCSDPTWGGAVFNETTPIPTNNEIQRPEILTCIKDTFTTGLLPVPDDPNDDIYIVITPIGKKLGPQPAYPQGVLGFHNVFKPTITISHTTIPVGNTEDQDPNYSFDGKGFAKGFLSVIVGNTGGRDVTEDLDKVTEDPLPTFVKKVEWDKHGYLWLEWTHQGRKLNARLYDRKDNALDNFTITNLGSFGSIPPPPPPNPGPDPPPTPPPPTQPPIPLDNNGIQWMVARGAISNVPQSRTASNDFRWSKNYNGIGRYGYEITAYFTFSGVSSGGHWACKMWGGNHTSPCGYSEGACCCWYDIGIRADGSVQLQTERPHPSNHDFTVPASMQLMSNIGMVMNGNTIGLKWLIYPIKPGGTADDGGIRIKMWRDITGLDASGRPKNNWVLVLNIKDTGQILGDFPNLNDQEIESRNSDTNSTTSYKNGLHVRLLRAGDADPVITPVPPPGPTPVPSATMCAVGDWDCNSTTDATISTMKSFNPGLIIGLGDYSYEDTKTCWISRIEAANIDDIMEITLGNHETAEGVPSSLKNEYRDYFGYSNYWHAHTFHNIRLIAMCSELDFTSGSAQHTFITNELVAAKNNAAIKWIIVYCHSPFYPPPSSQHGTGEFSPTLRSVYHQLFSDNDVDLVLYGHNHNWDRTFPLTYNSGSQGSPNRASTALTDYVNMQGKPIFMTAGIAGRGHYSIGNAVNYIAKRSDSFFGCLKIDISNGGNTLTVNTIKNDRSVHDSFTMRKT